MSTPNLAITHILQAQAQKEVTANAAFDALDQAVTDRLDVDLAADDVALTSAQFRQHLAFRAAGHVDTPPDELFAIDVTVDAVSIGTITISNAGTFTFATADNEPKTVAAGAVVRFVAPDPADTSIAGIAVTLVAALA